LRGEWIVALACNMLVCNTAPERLVRQS